MGAASVVGLAGCTSGGDGGDGGDGGGSGGDGGSSGGGTSGSAKTPPGASEWGNFKGEELHFVTGESDDASKSFWNTVAADFEEATGATTKMEYTGFGTDSDQRIAQLVQAGEAPEVNQNPIDSVSRFQNAGIMEPLTDVMEDEIIPRLGEPNEGSQFTIDGEWYMLPYWNNIGDFWYREDFAEQAGVDAPDTWDKVLAYAEAVDGIEPNMNGAYVAAGQGTHAIAQFTSWLYNNDGKVVDYDSDGKVQVTFDSGPERERFAETLEFERELHQYSPAASDSTWDTLASSMPQNTAASCWYVGFRPAIRSFRAEQDFAEHVRCVQHPESPSGSRTARGGADGLTVFKNTNVEMGKSFISFMMQRKYLVDLYMSIAPVHNIPCFPEFQQGDEYQEAIKELPYNPEDIETYQVDVANDWIGYPDETEPPNPYVGAVYNQSPLWDLQTEVLVGEADIDQAIDKYAPMIQENIDAAAGY